MCTSSVFIIPSKRKHTSWTYLVQDTVDEIEIADNGIVSHVCGRVPDHESSALGQIHFKQPINWSDVEKLLSEKYKAPSTKIAMLPLKVKKGKITLKKFRVAISP